MNRTAFFSSVAVVLMLALPGCGDSSCGWTGCPLPAQPIEQSATGIWVGEAVTPAPADVTTSFEFDAVGPFSVGTSPRTATFSAGVAETRGATGFYVTGDYAWHILVGTSASVTFETLPSSLSFWVRTQNLNDESEVQVLDQNGALIQSITPTNEFQEVVITRAAGETFIGSFDVTSTNGGDVIIDDLSFGFSSTTDSVDCVVAETLEVACVLTDTVMDEMVSAARATFQVSSSNQITGTGTLYAVPGSVLIDGSVVAALTIADGTFVERTSLNLTIEAAGVTTTVTATYDADYERGSSLETVAGVYTSFDIYGDVSSFVIEANGVIAANSNSGCVVDGQVTIIDGNFNAYDVSLDVSNCGGLNGLYDGLGITQDRNAVDDEFPFAVFTNQATIVGTPVK